MLAEQKFSFLANFERLFACMEQNLGVFGDNTYLYSGIRGKLVRSRHRKSG